MGKYPSQPHGWGTGSGVRSSIEIAPLAATIRLKALRELIALGSSGSTAEEMADRLGFARVSVQPRLSELRAMGKVRNSGQRRRNASSGKFAAVWVAVTEGGAE